MSVYLGILNGLVSSYCAAPSTNLTSYYQQLLSAQRQQSGLQNLTNDSYQALRRIAEWQTAVTACDYCGRTDVYKRCAGCGAPRRVTR